MTQAAWIIIGALPFVLVIIGLAYSRRGARPAEMQAYVKRLPRGVLVAQNLIRLAVVVPAAFAAHKGFADLHRVAHGDAGTAEPGFLSGLLMVEAAILLAVLPAYLLATLLIWLIPPLRRADGAARAGLPTLSLSRATLEMLVMAALMVPATLAQGVLAALEPWAR